jgi:hypothetical protein
MSQPVIFVIDHDAGVTIALRDDLDRRHGRLERVPATALFVLIGGEPHTQWLPEAVQRRYGYVLTGRDVARDGTGPSRWPLGRDMITEPPVQDRAPLAAGTVTWPSLLFLEETTL